MLDMEQTAKQSGVFNSRRGELARAALAVVSTDYAKGLCRLPDETDRAALERLKEALACNR